MKSCQYMRCSYETDWVNILFAVIFIRNLISHITYYSLVFFIAYAFKVCRTSKDCESLVLQDKCSNEIFFPLTEILVLITLSSIEDSAEPA